MPEPVKVATRSELPPGGKKLLDVDGRAIALFNVDGTFYAIDDVCTHDGGPLAEGDLNGCEIRCPRHGARFDVRTGKASLHARHRAGRHAITSRSAATTSSSRSRTEVRSDFGSASPDPADPGSRSHREPTSIRSTTMIDQETLVSALKTVKDPELNVNVVDLGLVYSIQTQDDQVDVEMTLTSPACPAGPEILRNAVAALEKVEGVTKANVKLVMSPPWSPDRMTDAARDELGFF